MRQRLHILTLLLALALNAGAQTADGITAMDQAIARFLQSNEFMTLDTHWSHNQQQWTFKYVAPTTHHPSSITHHPSPTTLTTLLDAFSQQVGHAAASYFHDVQDGEPPFFHLAYSRKDSYAGGIVGRYDMEEHYNFRILNFRDSTGLTSYGIQWCTEDFTDTAGQPFFTIEGMVFKLYGGIWQMEPFRSDNPWEPKDKATRRPISKSERAMFETLLSQMQYLGNLYQQNQQSGNEQNCDAIVYTMKNLMEGYEGKLTSRQYQEVKKTIPVFPKSEAKSERARMIIKAKDKLAKSVQPSYFVTAVYQTGNAGPFIKNDDLRLLQMNYRIDTRMQPSVVEVQLNGPIAKNATVTVTPVNPKHYEYSVNIVKNNQFSLTADFLKDQLLEVSDNRGHSMLLFADSTATTVDLDEMTLKGSPLNERFAACQRRLHALRAELKKYVCQFGFNHAFEIMDADGFSRVSRQAYDLQMQFIRENQDNIIPAWYLVDNYSTMTFEDLSRYLVKGRPYSDHIALQPVWQWYEGLRLRQPGQRFHDVECVDTEGNSHKLSDYIGHGDYVVLNFWATRRNITRSSCKTMKQLAKQYAGRNVRFIGFSLDGANSGWKQYVKARDLKYIHLSYPQDADHQQWDSDAAKAYGIQALPETIVFDPKGRIIYSGLGPEAVSEKLKALPIR